MADNEKLHAWKKLRNNIELMNLEEKLNYVSDFFSNFPMGARSVDYYAPLSWPSPWEIIFYGSFCKSSISILIFYTLCMSDNSIYAELRLVHDGSQIYLIPVINNTFVLNYKSGMVNKCHEVESEILTISIYKKEDIKLIA